MQIFRPHWRGRLTAGMFLAAWNTLSAAQRRLYNNPYALLTLAALFFGGNTTAGRLAVEHITPFQLVFLRWLLVTIAIGMLLGKKRLLPAWQIARPRARWLFAMGMTGFTCFNTLFYLAAHHTSAVNLGIIQGTVPVWVLAGVFIAHKSRARVVQIAGVLLTMFGVAVLTARGDFGNLWADGINYGDALMLLACFAYSMYTVLLANRPAVGSLELFFMFACSALISSVPMLVYEIFAGMAFFPTMQGWLVLLYVAIFPSCLSHIFFIRGVELIGPARAGVFINLVPIFAALCAVLIIDESLSLYQLSALVLVLTGITMSEKSGKKGIL